MLEASPVICVCVANVLPFAVPKKEDLVAQTVVRPLFGSLDIDLSFVISHSQPGGVHLLRGHGSCIHQCEKAYEGYAIRTPMYINPILAEQEPGGEQLVVFVQVGWYLLHVHPVSIVSDINEVKTLVLPGLELLSIGKFNCHSCLLSDCNKWSVGEFVVTTSSSW